MTAAVSKPSPWTGLIAGLGLAVLFVLSLAVGVSPLPVNRMLSDPEAMQLLAVSRLPRTLAAVLCGAGLAIAGLIMQTLSRNRFVEPATAGTAQSAELGILLVTLLFPAAALWVKTLFAGSVALVGTSIFLATAHRLPPQQPFLVPLFGIVYGGVIGAVATFAAWQADLLQFLSVWTNGEFSGVLRGRYELLWIAALMVAVAWIVADRLTIMALGRETSIGLGIDYARMMQIGLVIVSVITALAVVVVGMIPFVGLAVPNIVSRLMGDNVRGTLGWVAAGGAGLVLACDIAGRLIRYPYEIPVGTVMGVVGGVVFLWLLFRRGGHG
ncbi:iron chelate uptake ABC transporter family permease subunit [Shinella curvata]|uniref:Iron chelate uptake ABC transporter family permease subunit n=1 Tax=Shinella curvata TaxID=1817964 RepID=A0ABT8XBH3_9HYPH|nr:iron chelate uptake ABC transporter family permease subunit [Shinella curvata]MCJ8054999.1 iron chelate uptake ABC transporter family permease subunit [Shinella curvata]MDO6120605.1 iron chelate uptake ABC transporter family permease subunit [Shinella curvata]